MDCLIGHSGFVGQNLVRQHRFGACFNSATIGEALGRSFGLAVCAAAPGSMFEANRNPARDAERIERLIGQIGQIAAERFVLVSTIAVLADFGGADETTQGFETALAYGRNRHRLEEFVVARFPQALVVRLPALFGPGLKKNFLFDVFNPVPSMLPPARLAELRDILPGELGAAAARLYHHSEELGMWCIDRATLDASPGRADLEAAVTAAGFSAVRFTNPASRFQYYDITRLWADVDRCLAAGLKLVHLATEPLPAGLVHQRLTGEVMPASPGRVHSEDMRTCHAGLWGHGGGYIATAEEVLGALETFAVTMRAAR